MIYDIIVGRECVRPGIEIRIFRKTEFNEWGEKSKRSVDTRCDNKIEIISI